MPFKPAAQIKCPKCNKSVYAAEARKVGDDLSFHKECFKCSEYLTLKLISILQECKRFYLYILVRTLISALEI
jgi:hypothetical protein